MGAKYLILNQVRGEVDPSLLAEIEKEGLNLAGVIPEDDQIYEYDQSGQPSSTLGPDNPAVKAAYAVFDKTL